MDKIKVKKEKVISEFRVELEKIATDKRLVYDKPFFQTLNSVYKHEPNNIICNINRLKCLTFIIIVDHMYIYTEWSPVNPHLLLLSITVINDMDDGGIYHLPIEQALMKIDNIWKTEV